MPVVKVYDVMKAVRDSIKNCLPSAEVYMGALPENPIKPSFLMTLAYLKDSRTGYDSQSRHVSIQLIYFGKSELNKEAELVDQLETLENLRSFLNKFVLKVGERNLNFEFKIGKADGQMRIRLIFIFKDSIVRPEENYEMIESITLNEEAIS